MDKYRHAHEYVVVYFAKSCTFAMNYRNARRFQFGKSVASRIPIIHRKRTRFRKVHNEDFPLALFLVVINCCNPHL